MPVAKKTGAAASRKKGASEVAFADELPQQPVLKKARGNYRKAVADAAVAFTADTNGNGIHSDDAQNGVAVIAAPKTSARGRKKATPEPVEEQAAPSAKPVKGRAKKQAAPVAVVQEEEVVQVAAVAPEPENGAENVPDSTTMIAAPAKKGRGKKPAEPVTSSAVKQPVVDTVAVEQKATKRSAKNNNEAESSAAKPTAKKRGRAAAVENAAEVPVETLSVELKTNGRKRAAKKTETAAPDTNAKQPKQNKKIKVTATESEETSEPVAAAEQTAEPVAAAVALNEPVAPVAVAKPVKSVAKKVTTKAAKKMVPDESAAATEVALPEPKNKPRSRKAANEPINAAAAVENAQTEVVTTVETAVVNGTSSRKRAVAEQPDETAAEAKPNKKAKAAAKPKVTTTAAKTSRKRAVSVEPNEIATDQTDGAKVAKIKKLPMNATATVYNKEDFDTSHLGVNFKISSWNVAGYRAWRAKDGLRFLEFEQPHIFCMQETKCTIDQLPDEAARLAGYHPYWFGKPGGHVGVAIFSKIMPINVDYGIGNEEFDAEGRIITAEYEKFYLINVYVPNSGRKLVNLTARMRWEESFQEYCKKLDQLKPLIICGDMNVSHTEIDLANPKTNTRNAGFTLEERSKMSELLALGFVDTFRHLYPDRKGAYTFWTYMGSARQRNVGWRLDYFLVSQRLVKGVVDNCIRAQCKGSDHCPVTLCLKI